MADDDDICLNLETSDNRFRAKQRKEKLLKPTVQQKPEFGSSLSAVRKIANNHGATIVVPKKQTYHGNDSTTNDLQKSKGKKRRSESSKEQSNVVEPDKKRPKFSSLFTNNPEIPRVKSIEDRMGKEPVFAKKSFSSLSLHPFMVSNLEKLGITTMTSVQQEALPAIFEGRDALVRSQTGSGKTLAYAVPIIDRLQSQTPKVQRSDGPYCIVVVPTRELAIQTLEVFHSIVKPFLFVVPGSIMGGEKKKSEKARLRRGVNVLVATPGRLIDHIQHTKCLELSRIKYLVIDEADRLLDLGFEKDVSTLISTLQGLSLQHQTVLLSATLSAGVERLAGMSLRNPVRVEITSQSSDINSVNRLLKSTNPVDEFSTPESLSHHFVIVPSKLRLVTLVAFLIQKCKFSSVPGKVIVFLSTQDSVEFHYQLLRTCCTSNDEDDEDDKDRSAFSLDLFKLYGDMPQKERTKIFHEFHTASSGVLLCTDVAARGLDLPSVNWIVQYNTPGKPTDYIHRVGRTARLGVAGSAVLFLTPAEVDYVQVMGQHNISMKEIPMENVMRTLLAVNKEEQFVHKGERARNVSECATFLQSRFERRVGESKDLIAMARKAFQSFVRSYATYSVDMKRIFHVKNLHLGHVAKSFALAEAPSKISEILGRQVASKPSRHDNRRSSSTVPRKDLGQGVKTGGSAPYRAPRKIKQPDLLSEFASGL